MIQRLSTKSLEQVLFGNMSSWDLIWMKLILVRLIVQPPPSPGCLETRSFKSATSGPVWGRATMPAGEHGRKEARFSPLGWMFIYVLLFLWNICFQDYWQNSNLQGGFCSSCFRQIPDQSAIGHPLTTSKKENPKWFWLSKSLEWCVTSAWGSLCSWSGLKCSLAFLALVGCLVVIWFKKTIIRG